MKIIKISPRGFGANCYVLTQDDKTAVVIDPSQPRVQEELNKHGLTAKYVLLTHCHFDHVGGVSALHEAGAKVLCSEAEKPLVGTRADLFEACGIQIQTLLTAGHTAGSVSYLVTDEGGSKHLFTGDTLFSDSIGRTDFPTGDISALRKSLRRLSALPGDMPVYAGHNEETTIDRERKYNPFLVDL